jgi:hypothetical protein
MKISCFFHENTQFLSEEIQNNNKKNKILLGLPQKFHESGHIIFMKNNHESTRKNQELVLFVKFSRNFS